MIRTEPGNPFYFLLLVASLLFLVTALGYALVPTLEQKAAQAGQAPPPSALRDALRTDGPIWLICELGAMVIFGMLSMGLDRLRSLKKQQSSTVAPGNNPPSS
jgi:hypothetical protein